MSASAPLYKVTVILNPAADGGRARKKYEKYCAPVLHLAGVKVHVVRTEAEGQAKELLELLSAEGAADGRLPDAVLVAGGDGTVMEAVTGYMRRPDATAIRVKMPLGVLPVGQNNKLARCLYPEVSTELSDVELMAKSAMSCVEQLRRPMYVMQVENIGEEEPFRGKKIYGMREVQLGAFRDAHERLPKYWYWAGLKKAMAYVFGFTTAAKMHLWKCDCDIELAQERTDSEEEPQVSNTNAAPSSSSSSWWNFFFPSSSHTLSPHSGVTAPKVKEPRYDWDKIQHFKGVEVLVKTPNSKPLDDTTATENALAVSLGPEDIGFLDFVKEGWRRETNGGQKQQDSESESDWKRHSAPSLRLRPLTDSGFGREDGEDVQFCLDGEGVEVRGDLEVTLLRDRLVMFCSKAAAKEVKEEQVVVAQSRKWWQNRSAAAQLAGGGGGGGANRSVGNLM